VSRRFGVDRPASGVDTQQRRAELQDLCMGLVEVRDVKIQMELLRV
jgi:hypothetical protein